jgi:hypothetical protein
VEATDRRLTALDSSFLGRGKSWIDALPVRERPWTTNRKLGGGLLPDYEEPELELHPVMVKFWELEQKQEKNSAPTANKRN